MATLPAHLVATPVLERLTGEGRGVMLGAGATACWVDLDGFVVAVTTREVPLLPNAVALGAGSGALARPGLAAGGQRRSRAAGSRARSHPGGRRPGSRGRRDPGRAGTGGRMGRDGPGRPAR